MQSKVLNKVWSHGKSWGSHGIACTLAEIENGQPRRFNRPPLVDRILQRLSAAVPDIADWFPIFVLDDF